MTEAEVKANIKTCATPEALVAWIMHTINEIKKAREDDVYIEGYQKGVEEMAMAAKNVYEALNQQSDSDSESESDSDSDSDSNCKKTNLKKYVYKCDIKSSGGAYGLRPG